MFGRLWHDLRVKVMQQKDLPYVSLGAETTWPAGAQTDPARPRFRVLGYGLCSGER